MINYDKFPVHALPNLLGSAVWEVENNIMVPIPIAVSSAIGYLSLAAQAIADVERPNGLRSPTSLNFMVIADSGDRKSTADSIFAQPFIDQERVSENAYAASLTRYESEIAIWNTQYQVLLNESKKLAVGDNHEDLVSRLQHHIELKPKPPAKTRFIYKDVTVEALIAGLNTNGCSAGLISDEAISILNGKALSDLGLLNKLWDGGAIRVDRITKEEVVLNDARLTCSLMVQKKVFSNFVEKNNDQARSVGFLARFLICMPTSLQGTRLISDTPQFWDGVKNFNTRINELSFQSMRTEARLTLTFSSGAKAQWLYYFNEAERELTNIGELSEVKDFGSKYAENVARMAALFHLLEGNGTEISESHMLNACEICKWYLIEASKLFKTNHQTQDGPNVIADALELYDWFKRYTSNWSIYQPILVNKNTILQKGPNQLRNKTRLNAAVDKLTRSNVLSRYYIQGNRRVMLQFFPSNYFDVYSGLL